MSLRKGLLALFAGAAVAGAASAEPPRNPLVEGREPGPAVRLFHGAEPATFGYGGTAPAARAAEAAAGWLVPALVRDLVLDNFTVPLGTVPMWD
jgi:hypothetical protein